KRLVRRGLAVSATALSTGLAAEAIAGAVPGRLLDETISQAAAYAAGPGVGSVTVGSVTVRALAQGVMRSMTVSAVRIWVVTVIAASLLAGTAIIFAGAPAGPPEKKAA